MNLKPVKLINKAGNNICWWNAFVQLFAATRDQLIVNEMTMFINEHKCNIDNNNNNNNINSNNNNNNNNNNKQCWYCNIFKAFIATMVENNISYSIDFSKILFNVPPPISDPKDKNKIIYHPFYNFFPNMQQDSTEGCDQLFDVIKDNLKAVYKLFCITTIDQTTCNHCGIKNEPKIVSQHALAIPIDNNQEYHQTS